MKHVVFLFGEAEKGEFCTPLLCKSLPQLADTLGNPPQDSQGISYAVQALLYNRDLIYFRVKEEGFSTEDYLQGLQLLKDKYVPHIFLAAICMPGVGDAAVIDASHPICHLYKSTLILSQKDLYDYLTSLK